MSAPQTKKAKPETADDSQSGRVSTFEVYQVTLEGVTELLGGMPKTAKLIEAQMSSKALRLKAKSLGRDPERLVAENMAAMGVTDSQEQMEEHEELMSCGFRMYKGFLALGAHQVPSMLADTATTLRLSREIRGLVDVINRGCFAWQPGCEQHGIRCPFLRLDAEQPTETLEWGSEIVDRMGRRSILRRYDYVFPWSLEFRLRVVGTGVLSETVLRRMLGLGQDQGLGAARPRGYGRFVIQKFARLEPMDIA